MNCHISLSNELLCSCLPACLHTAEKEGESEDPTGRHTTKEKLKSVSAFSKKGKLLHLQVLLKINYQISGSYIYSVEKEGESRDPII